jgi:3-oxoacyl-[acyl-carrier-protein] synthase-3
LGIGRYLPSRKVSASEIDARLDMKPGTALKLSGVETRWVVDGENAAQMGAKAVRAALSNAGLDWSEIDAIVGTSGTPDQPIPCNAALIQEELGLGESGIPSFDINTTCMSFLAGFDLVSYLIEAGRFRKVLLVSSDIPSCGLNPKQIEAYCLFGDAAVAVVVGPSGKDESSRIHASRLEELKAEGQLIGPLRSSSSTPRSAFSRSTIAVRTRAFRWTAGASMMAS